LLTGLSLQAADDATRIRELEKRLEDLDQKYRALEKKMDGQQEQNEEKAKNAPVISVGSQGFIYSSADTNFVLRVKGLIQGDSRFYIDDGGNNRNDTFLLRRLRPIFEGTLWKNIDFMIMPEFGGGSVVTTNGTANTPSAQILDAYLNFRYIPELQLRAGKFKEPVGLEQLQSDSQMFFLERGAPSNLTPARDMGIMLHGEVLGGVVNYAAGIFNGVGDSRNSANLDFDDEKDFAGRLFFHPFLKTEIEPLRGFGFGVGGSYGNQDGVSGLGQFVTEAAQQFFIYANNVTADGRHWRITPQGYWYYGSFGLLGEYVLSDQVIGRFGSPAKADLQNRAWQIAGSYVLTGEDTSYRGVIPKKPFSLSDNQWGALEFVARYSHLSIDEEVFPTFADPATQAHGANAYTFGLNWYANRNIRTSLNYVHTDFQGGDQGAITRQDENAILTRLQLTF